jgi:metallophosphoesterase superfamily enzyme
MIAPFVFAHHPVVNDSGYVIAGHVHPGIRLYGPARQRERLPCFVFGSDVGILPAFGDFTGLGDIDPLGFERIYAIAEDRVLLVTSS